MPRWMFGGRRCVVWPGTSVYQRWMNIKTFLLKFHSTGFLKAPNFTSSSFTFQNQTAVDSSGGLRFYKLLCEVFCQVILKTWFLTKLRNCLDSPRFICDLFEKYLGEMNNLSTNKNYMTRKRSNIDQFKPFLGELPAHPFPPKIGIPSGKLTWQLTNPYISFMR